MNIAGLRVPILFVLGFLTITSCSNLNPTPNRNRVNYPFSGNWQGEGVDSEGNEATFAAMVIDLGDYKYRMLILDKLDTDKKPMHIMDGELKNNEFTYTVDDGVYVGAGELKKESFEGYYKGPVDGTFILRRIK